MFAEGRSVEKFRNSFDVQRSTVINHLALPGSRPLFDPARILALSQLELAPQLVCRLAATTECFTPDSRRVGGLVSCPPACAR